MNRIDREWAIKLDLMESIARSQASLALMLEHAAKVTTAFDLTPTQVRANLRAIANMQEALLTAATGVRWRKPKKGAAGKPWLAPFVQSVSKSGNELEVSHDKTQAASAAQVKQAQKERGA